MNKTPSEIISEISKLPPFQQKKIEDTYKDISINWLVRLNSVQETRDGKIKVSMLERHALISPMIFCNTNISDYPTLKLLQKDSLFRIKGRIEKVDQLFIYVKEAVLDFDIPNPIEENKDTTDNKSGMTQKTKLDHSSEPTNKQSWFQKITHNPTFAPVFTKCILWILGTVLLITLFWLLNKGIIPKTYFEKILLMFAK